MHSLRKARSGGHGQLGEIDSQKDKSTDPGHANIADEIHARDRGTQSCYLKNHRFRAGSLSLPSLFCVVGPAVLRNTFFYEFNSFIAHVLQIKLCHGPLAIGFAKSYPQLGIYCKLNNPLG